MPSIKYHGHSCFEIHSGDSNFIVDPFLTGNPLADIGPEDIAGLDAIFLTHGHGDHLGDAIDIATRTGATVVAPFELAQFCASKGCNVHPMHIGGGHEFTFGHVKMVVAIHGGGVDADETGTFTTIPCGYVLTLEGHRLYHTGDTALTMDMQLLNGRVDTMLLPIGDNFTMGIEDAARAVDFVRPSVAIPMHYNTFDVIEADPAVFAGAVGDSARVEILKPGQSYELN